MADSTLDVDGNPLPYKRTHGRPTTGQSPSDVSDTDADTLDSDEATMVDNEDVLGLDYVTDEDALDSSSRPHDRPNSGTDAEGTGERASVEYNGEADSDELSSMRVVKAYEAGLGGGLDQAEEAQLGITDEELFEDEEDD